MQCMNHARYHFKDLAALIFLCCVCCPALSAQVSKKLNMPEVHGTIRAKYEYEPQVGKGRFEIRNVRIGIEGGIIPIVRYKAEIDLSDEGVIKMLDAYVRVEPQPTLKFTFGHMRVPFSIDAHRSPHLQYFANRSFIAKRIGNVRDVGAAVAWTFGQSVPVTIEGGIFNGSGLINQKHYWTNDYNYSFKTQICLETQCCIALSCQKAKTNEIRTMMWDGGAFWQNTRWHIEAEYLRKYYSGDVFNPVNAIDAFVVYRIPLSGANSLSFLGRYDYMSDHSRGGRNDDGHLRADDPERHRLTGGVTLTLATKALQTDIRLNYEQYFYAKVASPSISERSKLVLEFVARF